MYGSVTKRSYANWPAGLENCEIMQMRSRGGCSQFEYIPTAFGLEWVFMGVTCQLSPLIRIFDNYANEAGSSWQEWTWKWSN